VNQNLIVLGINAYHPDASVALMKDGILLWAAEEERFNRLKHSTGFPKLSLQACLKETGIKPSEIDVIAISKNPQVNLWRKVIFAFKTKGAFKLISDRLKAFYKVSQFQKDICETLNIAPSTLKAKCVHVEHHQAHVASSFFVSGFSRAAFLSLDGMGDFSSAMWGIGEGNQLHVLDRVYFPHSAGFLYTAGTQFLGFLNFGDEYKVMGLAAYGKPVYLDLFRRLVRLKPNGQFELDLHYFIHQTGQAKLRWEGGMPEQDIIYSEKWTDLLGNPRHPEEEINERHWNLAASLQAILEEIYFHVLNHLYDTTKEENLCLAGGVAFNSVANGKITKKTPFKSIYVQPAAGDAGTSLGAAAFVCHSLYQIPRNLMMNHAFFGSAVEEKETEKILREKGLSCEQFPQSALLETVAQDLANGKVVGWFQGKMEFGPRALGNRSILADPGRPEMRDILNERIKHRENFRPFAPAIPEEKAHEYFDMDCATSPFMIKVFPVKSEKKAFIPAVTHVDGSARVQTVSKLTQPLFWNLLMAFGAKTGHPILLNTSFNEHEPIVCTPEEAVNCFLKIKMDVLVIGNYYMQKELQNRELTSSVSSMVL